jgi:hypothetical protein
MVNPNDISLQAPITAAIRDIFSEIDATTALEPLGVTGELLQRVVSIVARATTQPVALVPWELEMSARILDESLGGSGGDHVRAAIMTAAQGWGALNGRGDVRADARGFVDALAGLCEAVATISLGRLDRGATTRAVRMACERRGGHGGPNGLGAWRCYHTEARLNETLFHGLLERKVPKALRILEEVRRALDDDDLSPQQLVVASAVLAATAKTLGAAFDDLAEVAWRVGATTQELERRLKRLESQIKKKSRRGATEEGDAAAAEVATLENLETLNNLAQSLDVSERAGTMHALAIALLLLSKPLEVVGAHRLARVLQKRRFALASLARWLAFKSVRVIVLAVDVRPSAALALVQAQGWHVVLGERRLQAGEVVVFEGSKKALREAIALEHDGGVHDDLGIGRRRISAQGLLHDVDDVCDLF